MKKAYCILLVLVVIFLTSCGEIGVPVNVETSSSTADTSETIGTIGTIVTTKSETTGPSGTAVIDTSKRAGYTQWRSRSVETKSKVIILDSVVEAPTVFYYSKADGEFYPFCFDPFCDHRDKTKCIGTLINDPFRAASNARNLYYINSRLYFVISDKIYSCSELATDLRVDVSFDGGMIQTFTRDNDVLLFIVVDPSGNIIQYTYDTVSKKLTDIKKKMAEKEKELGATLYTYSFEDGKVYMAAYTNVRRSNATTGFNTFVDGDFKGYYVADYDFVSFSPTEHVPPVTFEFITDDGHVELIYKNENKTLIDIEKSMYGGSIDTLAEDITMRKKPFSLYLTDDSYYFYHFDFIEIGIDMSYNRGETPRPNSYGGKIYRLDLKTGEIKTVLDDLSYDAFKIIYINEQTKYGLMTLEKYEFENEFVTSKGGLLYQFNLDKSGNFVDLERVILE